VFTGYEGFPVVLFFSFLSFPFSAVVDCEFLLSVLFLVLISRFVFLFTLFTFTFYFFGFGFVLGMN